jgi:putative addiction module killer protein
MVIEIYTYTTSSGKVPFNEWLFDLDGRSRAIVKTRLDRIRLGNFGDTKQIMGGDGIWELRIDYGPGYRVYYAKKGKSIVVLLLGGDKGGKSRDIAKAKRYWLDYRSLHE